MSYLSELPNFPALAQDIRAALDRPLTDTSGLVRALREAYILSMENYITDPKVDANPLEVDKFLKFQADPAYRMLRFIGLRDHWALVCQDLRIPNDLAMDDLEWRFFRNVSRV